MPKTFDKKKAKEELTDRQEAKIKEIEERIASKTAQFEESIANDQEQLSREKLIRDAINKV